MSSFILNKKWRNLSNDTRYFIATGGRGSSKSFSITAFLLGLTYEKGHTILFTRYTLTSAYISIIPEFTTKIDYLGLQGHFHITKDEIINLTSGSKILFRGIKTSAGNQTANLKSLEGVTTWVLDEAEELTDEETFDKINLSVRKKGVQNRVILILNPTTKQHWIYTRFYENRGVEDGFNGVKGNTTYIHTSYLDNLKHLDEDFIADIEQMKVLNPAKYKHQILGGWLDKAEGVIFTNWQIKDFPKELTDLGYGLDFGYSIDPTALIQVHINKSKREIHCKELTYRQRMTTSDIIADLKEKTNGLVVADSAEGRLIDEIKAKHIKIVPIKKTTIIEGIALLQDYTIYVDSSSTNLIKELNNYVWLEKKIAPIDDWNHLIDALRYYVTNYHKSPNYGTYHVR